MSEEPLEVGSKGNYKRMFNIKNEKEQTVIMFDIFIFW